MADFENNVLIDIRETGSRSFPKMTKATSRLVALNAQLEQLIALSTSANVISGLDFTKLAKSIPKGAGKLFDEGDAKTASDTAKAFDEVHGAINKINSISGKAADSSVNLGKVVGANNEIFASAAKIANTYGVKLSGVNVKTVQVGNNTQKLIGIFRNNAGVVREVDLATGKLENRYRVGLGGAIDGVTNSIVTQTKEMTRIIGKVLIWTAATGAVFAAIRLLKDSVGTFAEFEGETVALARVARFGATDVKNLSDEVLDLSAQLGSNVIKSQQAAVSLARLGLTSSQVAKTVEVALLAQNVAEISVEVGTKRLIAAINQFQKEMSQTIDVLDEWNELSNKNAVTVNDLSQAVAIAGSVFKAYGADIQDLNSLTTLLAETTAKSGSEIGNALKTIGSFTFRPETIRTIERLTNIEVQTETGELKNLNVLLTELSIRFNELTEAQQNELVTSIAGARQRNFGIIALRDFDKVLENNVEQFQASGSAAKENIAVLESFGGQVKQLGATLDSAKIKLGEMISKMLKEFIPVLKVGINVIKSESFQVSAMAIIVTGLGVAAFFATKAFIALAAATGGIGAGIAGLLVSVAAVSAIIVSLSDGFTATEEAIAAADKRMEAFNASAVKQIAREERRLSLLKELDAVARSALKTKEGELKTGKALEEGQKKLLKLAESMEKANILSEKSFLDILESQDATTETGKELERQQKKLKEIEENRIPALKEHVEQAKKRRLEINKEAELARKLLAPYEKIGIIPKTILLNGLPLVVLRKKEQELTGQTVGLTRIIESAQKSIVNLLTKSKDIKAEINQDDKEAAKERLKSLIAEAKIQADIFLDRQRAERSFKKDIFRLFTDDDIAIAKRDGEILREEIDKLKAAKDDFQRQIESGRLGIESGTEAEVKIKLAVTKTELTKLEAELKKFDELEIGKRIFANFSKQIDSFFKITTGLKAELAEAFGEGTSPQNIAEKRDILQLELDTLRVKLDSAEADKDKARLSLLIRLTESELLETQIRLQRDAIVFHREKLDVQRESLKTAKEEALLLESTADIFQRFAEIEDIQNLEALDAEVFLKLPPDAKRLLEQIRPDLYEDVLKQLDILPDTTKTGAERFEEARALAEKEFPNIARFSDEIPNILDLFEKAGKTGLEANEMLKRLLQEGGVTAKTGIAQEAVFGANIQALAEGVTLHGSNLIGTLVLGIQGIADTIVVDQEKRLSVELNRFREDWADFLETQGMNIHPKPGND